MSESQKKFLKRMFNGSALLWIVTGFLCLVSALESYSASLFFVVHQGDITREPIKHFSMLVFSFVVAMVISKTLRREWLKWVIYFVTAVGGIFLVLLLLPKDWHISIGGIELVGVMRENSASRWITIMGVPFQPSEFMKLGLIGLLSITLTWDVKDLKLVQLICRILQKDPTDESFTNKCRWWLSISMIAFVFLLIFTQNLSTAALIAIVGFAMVFASGVWDKACWRTLALGIAAVTLFLTALSMSSEDTLRKYAPERALTWKARIEGFFHSNEEYNDENAQIMHSKMAIARGELFGQFPGNSVERDYLPQVYADFVYAIIVEELGLVGGASVMFLFIVLLWRCGVIVKNCKDNYLTLMVMGLGFVIVLQAAISMMVAVGLGPVTGQPLPLISRGRTSILITMIYIGIIQFIGEWMRKQNEAEEKASAEIAETQGEERPHEENER